MNLKPVCFLLGVCHAASAPALGLGELNLRSYLGQPLHATVTVLDAGATTDAECFRVEPGETGIAPPARVHLALERAGDKTLLHLRTPQSLNDPIAQFVLVSVCEGRLQREYAVLLDPPERAAPPEAAKAAPVTAAALPSPGPRRSAAPVRTPRAAAKATSPARKPVPRVQAGAGADAAPHLVLSGRRMAHEARSKFALKLDTNLPDLTRALPEGLTATELSDENTALTRKLAHLESQLLALKKRNAELDARRAPTAPPPAVTPPAPERSVQWPLYLLVTGMLTAVGTLIVWLRRRPARSDGGYQDTWTPPSRISMPEPAPAADEPLLRPADPQSAAARMFEIAPPAPIESTEVKDDILDQAEVYMAHGHGDLAVHLLQEHLREMPTESPIPWLLLLDLLHREGDTAGYAAASAECRRHFNINLSTPPVSQDGEPSQGLEAYPHLMERLVEMWRAPNVDDFFTDLIYDNRGGTRTGFEPGAYRDILLLRAISRDVLPLAA